MLFLRTGALLLAICGSVLAEGQQATPSAPAPPATGLILGRAIDPSGKPISEAEIALTSADLAPALVAEGSAQPLRLRMMSDGDGYFVFRDLPKGSYALTGTKAGYLPTVPGRRTATDTGSQSIVLGEGDRRGDITLTFWKYATVSGTVVDEAGEPIIGMEVRVLRRTIVAGKATFAAFGNTVETDDRGVYRAPFLTPGDYAVGIVNTQATVPTAFQSYLNDASRSGGGLEVQRELSRSALNLTPGMFSGGQRVGAWLLETAPSSRQATLPPLAGGKAFVYPTVFYPSAPVPSKATALSLRSGEDREAIDFQLRPVATAAVSGTVAGPSGPEAFLWLGLIPASAEADRDLDLATATTLTDPTGAFVFLGVPTGTYTIRALKVPLRPPTVGAAVTVIQTGSGTISSSAGGQPTPPIPDDPTLWGTLAVSVEGRDVTDLGLTLTTGARLTGRVEFTGGAQKPPEDRLRMIVPQVLPADRTMVPGEFELSRGSVDATGQFKTYQLPPGRYELRGVVDPPGWFFRNATLNGRDVTDAPFEIKGEDIGNIVITYVDQQTKLTGTVRGASGPDLTAAVIAFPAQPEFWVDYGTNPRRLKVARPSTTGTYTFTGLPPGDYLVVAVHADLPADWTDAKYLQKAAALAAHLTLGDRESKSLDLTPVEVR